MLISPIQLFVVAEEARARGDISTAESAYRALTANPDLQIRTEARFRLGLMLSAMGRQAATAVLFRQILDEQPKTQRVRLELARVLEQLGDENGARRALREVQAGPLPTEVARFVDRYSAALRARKPFGATFEVAIAPDSNINHATRSDTLGTIFGDFDIDHDSKAKSGTGVSLRGQMYRRFAIGAVGDNLLVRLSGSSDFYGKSAFNDIAADIAGGPELKINRNTFNFELGATQRWFGQKRFMSSARLGATWARPLGARTQIRVNGSASLVNNQLNDLQDGKAYSGQVGLERALSPTTGIAISLGADRQSLEDAGYSTTGWRAGLLGWKDVGRATLMIGAEMGHLKADERLALFPKLRSDRYSRLTMGATFRQLTFQGFAPIARFTVERNRSSIEFYDYRRRRTELGIVRAF